MFVSLVRANKNHINTKGSVEEEKYIRQGRSVEVFLHGISVVSGLVWTCTCISRRVAGFHRQAKPFKLNFFLRKRSSGCSNQGGKIIFSAIQFGWCPSLNETPGIIINFNHLKEQVHLYLCIRELNSVLRYLVEYYLLVSRLFWNIHDFLVY